MDSLNELLENAGLSVAPQAVELMEQHARLVLATNQTLNLTRIVEWPDVLRLHILDSLLALTEVEQAPPGRMLDMGSGAGYPGVPLSIATHRPCLLVESIKKKAAFLELASAQLNIQGLSCAAVRVEELASQRQHREAYAVVTARAVSKLVSLVELARPLLSDNGVLIALKADLDDEELRRARTVAARVGMSEKSVRRLTLPGGSEQRTLVTFARTGKSTVSLPRRVGLAQKSPLG